MRDFYEIPVKDAFALVVKLKKYRTFKTSAVTCDKIRVTFNEKRTNLYEVMAAVKAESKR
jgi:hypothetical protein